MTSPPPREVGPPRPVGGTSTFGGRKGRMSPTRQRALNELVPRYRCTTPVPECGRVIVEIGCGKGDATAVMAPRLPHATVIACDVNEATIAHLAQLLDRDHVTNVRLWVGDAFDCLDQLGPQAVDEVWVWFPDPWPKPRHASKRLITPQRLAHIVDSMRIGARLRLATDDAGYAAQALAAVEADPLLRGRFVARPGDRPVTKFEARGLRAGLEVFDIEALRTG